MRIRQFLETSPTTWGCTALALAAINYSFHGVLIHAQARHMNVYAQLAARMSIALLIICLIMTYKKQWPLPHQDRKWLILFGIVTSLYPLAFTVSILHIKATNTVLFLYVGSIISAFVAGRLLFKEKITTTKLAGLLLSLFGLAVFAYPFRLVGAGIFGAATGLATGVLDTAGNGLRKKLTHLPTESLLFVAFAFCTVIMLTLAVASNDPIIHAPLDLGVSLVILLHGVSLVALNYLLIIGFRRIEVQLGVLVLASEIFGNLVINYLFLHEIATVGELVGAGMIFAASGLAGIATLIHASKTRITVS